MSVTQTVSEGPQEAMRNRQLDRDSDHAGQPPAPPGQAGSHTGGSLTRVTANFTPRAMAALDRLCEKTGDSRTDVLNMAVMVYETILDLTREDDGKTLRVLVPRNDKETEVRVLQFVG